MQEEYLNVYHRPTAYEEQLRMSMNKQRNKVKTVFKSDIPFHDEINHPKRYTKGKIECIDAQEAAVIGKSPQEALLIGPIIKYLFRYEEKGGYEDIEKAQWYLNRLLKKLKAKCE